VFFILLKVNSSKSKTYFFFAAGFFAGAFFAGAFFTAMILSSF